MSPKLKTLIQEYAPYGIFATALVSMLGSLYFSDVLKLPPCVLCWYQRIAMYPIVVLAAVGIIKNDKNFTNYVLPLAVIGWGISLYHNLLYYKILPESIQPCTFGISCTTKFIEWFGFVTIPFLSFVSFTAIITMIVAYRKAGKNAI